MDSARDDAGQGEPGALTRSEREEQARLWMENRELRMDRKILRKPPEFVDLGIEECCRPLNLALVDSVASRADARWCMTTSANGASVGFEQDSDNESKNKTFGRPMFGGLSCCPQIIRRFPSGSVGNIDVPASFIDARCRRRCDKRLR